MKQYIVLAAVVAIAFWGGSQACPRTKTDKQIVPKIVTEYDTVEVVPKWLADSAKVWKKRAKPTINVISETVVDTEFVPVGRPPEERPNIWPLMSVHGARKWGDTLTTVTFNLRDGRGGVSRVFATGYITDIEVGAQPTPQITFKKFPPAEKHGFFHNPKVFGIGLATGTLVCLAFC